jgi:hypothetical protein
LLREHGRVPTLSFFFGIQVLMFTDDHDPAHFHVRYAEFKAKYEIDPLRKIQGNLPTNTERLVLEWAQLHQADLSASWKTLRCGGIPSRIPGLR